MVFYRDQTGCSEVLCALPKVGNKNIRNESPSCAAVKIGVTLGMNITVLVGTNSLLYFNITMKSISQKELNYFYCF